MNVMEKAKSLEPMIRIGKGGLTDGVIAEVKKQLQQKKLIKVKFLRSALEDHDKKDLFAKLALATSGNIVMATGFVVVLQKT